MRNTLGGTNEIWKDIEGYEKLYMISNLGNVYSNLTNKKLKPGIDKGYLKVNLRKNNKTKQHTVHRLVAKAFIPNSNQYPCINHKDENPSNNSVDNLEWCTYKYNNTYGTKIERTKRKLSQINKGENHPMYGRNHTEESKEKISKSKSKPIICITTNEIFISCKDASIKKNINCGNISECCKGKRKTAGKDIITGQKMIWEYLKKEEK